jgi:hypothetical protein
MATLGMLLKLLLTKWPFTLSARTPSIFGVASKGKFKASSRVKAAASIGLSMLRVDSPIHLLLIPVHTFTFALKYEKGQQPFVLLASLLP